MDSENPPKRLKLSGSSNMGSLQNGLNGKSEGNQNSGGTSKNVKYAKYPALIFYFKKKTKKEPEEKPFEMTIDMSQYKPEQISVRVLNMYTISVEASSKKDPTILFEQAEFVQRIKLPTKYNSDLLSVTYLPSKQLKIFVPPIDAKRPLDRFVPLTVVE